MPDKTSKHIGSRLQIARQHKNMTQAEVAERVGTKANYYAKLERGEAVSSLKMFEKICKVLDVKSSDILPF